MMTESALRRDCVRTVYDEVRLLILERLEL